MLIAKRNSRVVILTKSGNRVMRAGAGDSGVWLHSVWTPDWHSLSYSSLRMRDNWMNKAGLDLSIISCYAWCQWTVYPAEKWLESPVSVVWSVGGSVSLLALCLCHMLCPSLMSVHWHWSLSNVHGPRMKVNVWVIRQQKEGGWIMTQKTLIWDRGG